MPPPVLLFEPNAVPEFEPKPEATDELDRIPREALRTSCICAHCRRVCGTQPRRNQGEMLLLTTGGVIVVVRTESKTRRLVVVGAEAPKAAAAAERHGHRMRGVARALRSARVTMRGVRSRGRGWS